MKETKQINEKDHDQMIKDFEIFSRHEDIMKQIRKRWLSESKKFKQTCEKMRENRDEAYTKRKAELVERLNTKEKLLITALEAKKKDKLAERERAIETMIRKEKAARANVQKYMEQQERDRIKFERRTHDKSKLKKNKLYIIIYKIIFYKL